MVDRSASTSSLPVTHGPETQMLNLKILQNLSQSNIYRDEKSKEGVRSLEKTLLGEGPRYTHRQAALAAGMDPQKARKIWRNMGFSDTPAEEHYFSDRDVQLLRTIVELEREGEVTFESAQSIVRSVGQLTDRIVAWQIESLVDDIVAREGVSDAQARRTLLFKLPKLMPALEELAMYGYRRQMYSGVLRLALRENRDPGESHKLPLMRGVGFVDMVSYTSLVRSLDKGELSRLITHFEQSCLDVIVPRRGRIIKTLGDEAFFLTESPESAAEISCELVRSFDRDPQIPGVRVGFIWGEVLASRGDVYGSSVNLASRLVSIAEPGTALTDSVTADVLRESETYFRLTEQGTKNVRSFGNIGTVSVSLGSNNTMESTQ